MREAVVESRDTAPPQAGQAVSEPENQPPGSDGAEEPVVSIRHLYKRFGNGPVILDDINIEARRGDFITLIGPSGCGKSTLLKLIASLTPITDGELLIEGKTPEEMRGQLAFIFQEATLLPWLTARKNVELPLRLQGVDKERREAIATEMLGLVGLSKAAKQFPRQLSGGMKMRVSVARALSLSPKVLLLDEPFGALDEMTRDRLNEDLLNIRQNENWTAFFVTHSVSEAVFLSSKIVVLSANPGKVAKVVDVPFAFPRTGELRESEDYQHLVASVSHELRTHAEGANTH
jgi:NitT/TauT family transport system ATP-binding protein